MTGRAGAGRVFLVGAGPGDPELITVRGLRRLKEADVVVYDRLVHPALVLHARAGAAQVFAGKAAGGQGMTQAEINALLVEHARAGRTVCRLKGGDPFVFGRGGEEALALRDAGIPFEIVPGVTSAVAAPAYAGIPVTHRGLASTFAVLAGREGNDAAPSWAAAAEADTAIFLMAVEALPEIVRRLLEQGRSPETPAALVQCGTVAGQRTVTATVATIAAAARAAGIAPPAVLVAGEVVRLREALGWFDRLPLFGRRIAITRPLAQAEGLSSMLRDLGAEPLALPLIRIEPIPNPHLDPVNRPHDWTIFTSANGARCLAAALREAGRDVRALGTARIAAVGEATARAVEEIGLRVDFVPGEAVGESIAREFPEPLPGLRFLMVRARHGREALPEALRAAGASVDPLSVYETVEDDQGAEEVEAAFGAGRVDAVVFTSPSTVRAFRKRLPEAPLDGVAAVCIGPVTAEAARQHGFAVAATAENASDTGLVQALAAVLGGPTPDRLASSFDDDDEQ